MKLNDLVKLRSNLAGDLAAFATSVSNHRKDDPKLNYIFSFTIAEDEMLLQIVSKQIEKLMNPSQPNDDLTDKVKKLTERLAEVPLFVARG